jgi:hypothetical protein
MSSPRVISRTELNAIATLRDHPNDPQALATINAINARIAAQAARVAVGAPPVITSRMSARERQAISSAVARRSAENALSRNPHDVVANATLNAFNAVRSARAARAAAISSIHSAMLHDISNRVGFVGRRSRRGSTRNDITNARIALETNISSLYTVHNDLLQYFNVNQLLYFARSSLYETYYYRRLELTYGTSIINKFGDICEEIISTRNYQNVYDEIVLFLSRVNDEIIYIRYQNRVRRGIINEILANILSEKTMITDLIAHLTSIRITLAHNDPIITAINQLLLDLNTRLVSINGITYDSLYAYFSQQEFEFMRNHIITLLRSAIILGGIFLVSLQYLLTPNTAYPTITVADIIDNMFNAISNFTFIVNNNTTDAPSYISDMEILTTVQSSFYQDIARNLSDAQFALIPVFMQRNLMRIIRERLARERRDQRTAQVQAARAARDAIREAARLAREARAAARAAARAPAPVSAALPAQPVTSAVSTNIPNVEHMMVDNSGIIIPSFAANQLLNMDARYIRFINELQNKVIEYSNDFSSDATGSNNRKATFRIIKKKYKSAYDGGGGTATSIKHVVGNSIASLYGRFLLHSGDMKFNNLSTYFVVNYTLVTTTSVSGINTYSLDRQAGIDAGGLRRDFITSLTNELFDKKIFVTREGTKKYFLNPDFKMDDSFVYVVSNIYRTFNESTSYNTFYNFIGKLLSFILVNDCGIVNTISSYIIANFYKDRFTPQDYLYYMFDDFSEFSNSMITMMKTPENIEYTYINFNDTYKLTNDDIELSDANVEEYLYKTAEFMMTTTINRKDIEIPQGITPSSYATYITNAKEKLTWLIDGIPTELKDELRTKKFTLKSINAYLVLPTMSIDIINKLKDNFRRAMDNDINSITNHAKKTLYQKFTNLFIEYVLGNTHNPKSEDEYFKFMDKLLRFWSGSSFFMERQRYTIKINTTLSPTHLPQSHTCFYIIDLPRYVGNDAEIGNTLYSKIETAILNVESGLGLAGGSRYSNTYTRSLY